MPATPAHFTGFAPKSSSAAGIPPSAVLPLAASSQVGRGQFATINASGDASLNDGSVPGLVCAGIAYPETLSDSSPVAAGAATTFWWGFSAGAPASTIASDGFTKADMGVPFFIADENTAGKKSNHSGSNRSPGGLVFGVDERGNPILWSGPVAQLVARAALVVSAAPLASFSVADAAASDAITERVIRRPKWHGTVTGVTFTGAAIAADNTDYVTITIAKRDGGGGGATTIATYDSRAANQGAATAFTPKAFALSVVAGAVDLLESDVVTITIAKAGAGMSVIGEILVNGKVI
jgi:hypothetical protein